MNIETIGCSLFQAWFWRPILLWQAAREVR